MRSQILWTTSCLSDTVRRFVWEVAVVSKGLGGPNISLSSAIIGKKVRT